MVLNSLQTACLQSTLVIVRKQKQTTHKSQMIAVIAHTHIFSYALTHSLQAQRRQAGRQVTKAMWRLLTALSAEAQTRRRAVGMYTQSVTHAGPFTMVLWRDRSAGDHSLHSRHLRCYNQVKLQYLSPDKDVLLYGRLDKSSSLLPPML